MCIVDHCRPWFVHFLTRKLLFQLVDLSLIEHSITFFNIFKSKNHPNDSWIIAASSTPCWRRASSLTIFSSLILSFSDSVWWKSKWVGCGVLMGLPSLDVRNSSSGTGKMIVEFFSAAIELRVWRYRNCVIKTWIVNHYVIIYFYCSYSMRKYRIE